MSLPDLVIIESSRNLVDPTIGNLFTLSPAIEMLLPTLIFELTDVLPTRTTVFAPTSLT